MKRLVPITAVGLTSALLMPLGVGAQPPSPVVTADPSGDPSAEATADMTNGYCLVYRAPVGTSEATLGTAADMLDARLGSMGIAGEATVGPGAATICVEIGSGPADLAAATDLAASLGKKGDLRFVPVPSSCFGEAIDGAPPPACLAEVPPLFDGSAVAYAEVGNVVTRQDGAVASITARAQSLALMGRKGPGQGSIRFEYPGGDLGSTRLDASRNKDLHVLATWTWEEVATRTVSVEATAWGRQVSLDAWVVMQ